MTNTVTEKFRSKYFYRLLKGDYNIFTPNHITVNEREIQFRRRNWYLISSNTQTFNFQHVIGLDVDKHLFGATIIIRTSGSSDLFLFGFSKKQANTIKDFCLKYIHANSRSAATEVLRKTIITTSETSTQAIVTAVESPKQSPSSSVADELKKLKELLDNGTITQQDFDRQKSKLIG